MAEQTPGISVFQPPKGPPTNNAPATPVSVPGPEPGVLARSNPPEAPWQARWRQDQEALTKERPWSDPNLVLRKDADGNIRATPRNGQQPAASPAAGDQPQGLAAPQTPAVDGGTLKVGQYELSEADIAGLLERRGIEESRKATVPETAEGYKFDVDFKKDGVEFVFNHADPVTGPLLDQARQVAHEAGLSQEHFTKFMSLYAAAQVQEKQVLERAKTAELAKLGALAPVRIDALQAWIRGLVGDADARPIVNNLWTAAQVSSLEKMMAKYVSGGISGAPGAARDGGAGRSDRLSDEAYGKLSYHEKLQYAERMSQGGR